MHDTKKEEELQKKLDIALAWYPTAHTLARAIKPLLAPLAGDSRMLKRHKAAGRAALGDYKTMVKYHEPK